MKIRELCNKLATRTDSYRMFNDLRENQTLKKAAIFLAYISFAPTTKIRLVAGYDREGNLEGNLERVILYSIAITSEVLSAWLYKNLFVSLYNHLS